MVHGIICYGIIYHGGMACCRIIYLGAMRLPLTLLHLLRKMQDGMQVAFPAPFFVPLKYPSNS